MLPGLDAAILVSVDAAAVGRPSNSVKSEAFHIDTKKNSAKLTVAECLKHYNYNLRLRRPAHPFA